MGWTVESWGYETGLRGKNGAVGQYVDLWDHRAMGQKMKI